MDCSELRCHMRVGTLLHSIPKYRLSITVDLANSNLPVSREEVVRVLVAAGADVNHRNHNGLCVCGGEGDTHTHRYIPHTHTYTHTCCNTPKHAETATHVYATGSTPSMLCVRNTHSNLLDILLELGGDLFSVDKVRKMIVRKLNAQ